MSARLDPHDRAVLSGDLDAAGSMALRAVLDQAMLLSREVVAIDGSGVTFVDSAGMRELLRYAVVAAANQRRLTIVSASPLLSMAIDALDLSHILLPPER